LKAAPVQSQQRHEDERCRDIEFLFDAQRPERDNDIGRQIILQEQRVVNHAKPEPVRIDREERYPPCGGDAKHRVIGRQNPHCPAGEVAAKPDSASAPVAPDQTAADQKTGQDGAKARAMSA
jgi:hypothetical protein